MIIAGPMSLSAMRTRTESGSTPSVSAATRSIAVRAPVPTSAALIRTVNVPSGSAVTAAVEGPTPEG